MEYRGYTGRATYDAEAKVWFGEVENLRDVVTFEAKEEPEVESAFRASVDDYLDMLAARSSSSSDERSVHPSDAELSRRQRCDARLESDAVPAFDADGESIQYRGPEIPGAALPVPAQEAEAERLLRMIRPLRHQKTWQATNA